MRHKNANRKLSKATDQRLAMLRSLVEALFERGAISTSLVRGKETSRLAEKILGWARADNQLTRRKVARLIRKKELLGRVFDLAKTVAEGRPGGFTRIIKIGFRRGDAAPMVRLELA